MSLEERISELQADLREARLEILELRRRVRNVVRVGRVKKVDPKTARVDVVDEPEGGNKDERLELNGIPWLEAGANVKGGVQTWNPPKEQEQVLVVAKDGNPRKAVAICGAFSDEAPAPSQEADTRVVKVGELTVRQKGESYFVMLGEDSAKVHVELSKERVRGRHGDARYVAKPGTYSKIRRGDTWVVADGTQIRVSHLPKVMPDVDED